MKKIIIAAITAALAASVLQPAVSQADNLNRAFNSKSEKMSSADHGVPGALSGASAAAVAQSPNDPVFRTKEMREFLEKAKAASPDMRLNMVNDYWNRLPYRQDNEVYGKAEHWASPSEFVKNGGDCEDYAIAKYATLRHLGVSANKMRIFSVEDLPGGGYHAILAVSMDGKVYVLTNGAMRVHSQKEFDRAYFPVSSVNEKAAWKHSPDNRGQRLKKSEQKKAGKRGYDPFGALK